MMCKVVNIQSDRPIDIDTEIKFSIATARVENIELIRFDIKRDEEALGRVYNSGIKCLKKMKNQGNIQFIATRKSFANSNAEAEFLLNKYPDQIDNMPIYGDDETYIFVKLWYDMKKGCILCGLFVS